jgi:hypothetical protein
MRLHALDEQTLVPPGGLHYSNIPIFQYSSYFLFVIVGPR